MSITAADVKKLRDMTGAGMMDCKKALGESNGDFDAAVELLRKKGQKVSEKRADRDAEEGAIVVKLSDDAKEAVALELNCETDFVAKNEEFVANATEFAEIAYKTGAADVDALKNESIGNITVGKRLEELVGKIGEKIDVSRFVRVKSEGQIISYIHPGNQLAVLVEFEGALDNADLGKDVAMQIAAMKPIAVNRDEVDATVIQKELDIAKEQLINEGKTEEIAEKAAKGKLRRFYEESVLLEQKFVKDGSVTVSEFLKSNGAPNVLSFTRLQLGEYN